jgi:hypothetical protein
MQGLNRVMGSEGPQASGLKPAPTLGPQHGSLGPGDKPRAYLGQREGAGAPPPSPVRNNCSPIFSCYSQDLAYRVARRQPVDRAPEFAKARFASGSCSATCRLPGSWVQNRGESSVAKRLDGAGDPTGIC